MNNMLYQWDAKKNLPKVVLVFMVITFLALAGYGAS